MNFLVEYSARILPAAVICSGSGSQDAGLLALIEQELSEETQALLSCLAPKDQELFLRIYAREEMHSSTLSGRAYSRLHTIALK